MTKKTIKIEPLLTRAKFDSSTFDKEKRTVDIVLATETLDVRRWDYRQNTMYIEQLVISPETVRMDRINAGAPFLDNHNAYGSVRTSLGKVVNGSAVISGNKIRCKVQFSNRDEVRGVMQDVADGILENISLGYNIFKMERQPVVDGETPIYRVLDWEPYEATLVLIPADIDAGVGRGLQGNKDQATDIEIEIVDAPGAENTPENLEVIETGNRTQTPPPATNTNANNNNLKINKMNLKERALAVGLPENATEAEIVAAENRAKTEKENEIRKKGEEAERTRAVEITGLVRKMKLPTEFGDTLIKDGVTLEQARALVIDEVAKGDGNFRNNVVVTGKDETEKKRDAIIAGLVLRSGAIDYKLITPEEETIGAEYRSLSLLELAKNCLEAERPGSTRGLDKMEIAKRAITSHSTDFPILLEGTNRRIVLAAYKNTPDTWRRFCAIGSVSDFRDWKRLRTGSIGSLDSLSENGEYKIKKLTDATSEKIAAVTKGNIINISRVMIVNDDLQGFARLAQTLGRAAARTIEIDVYALLALNGGLGPNMTDGKSLFHADHGNIAAVAAAPSMASFEAMDVLLSSQKDRDGNEYLDATANIWLGPKTLHGLAKSINGSKFDPDSVNKLQKPNIVEGMFEDLIGTPRMAGTRWYGFSKENPVIEVAFLDGQQNPFLESDQPFNVDGLSWKVRHDFGVGAIDYVGAATNAGA